MDVPFPSRRASLLIVMLLGVLALAAANSASVASTLTCVVVSEATGDTLAARCRITDTYSNVYYPPLGTVFRYNWWGGFFYTDGIFPVELPPGEYRFRIGHGFEHVPADTSIVMGSSDTTIVLCLEQVVDMEGFGWYGGDCHLHINHGESYYGLVPANAHLFGRAEDLRIVNCLDNDYFFTGGPDPCSTEECIVYMTEEYRSGVYGHMGLLGLEELVSPVSSFWWPTTWEMADSTHLQENTLVISAHPVSSEDFADIYAWPGSGLARALPVDIIEGRIDAFEVMSYSNCHGGIELEMWYRLLNCGFHLPGCGGSDACMNLIDTAPLGGYRTYVFVGGTPFTSDGWFDGIRAGRTFVSNAPLITDFGIEGAGPGEFLNVSAAGESLDGTLAVTCAYPLGRAEIVRNGTVVQTILFESGASSIDTSFTIFVDEGSWVAARVYGPKDSWLPVGDSLFAHTSPVYLPMLGQGAAAQGDALYMAGWVEDLGQLVEAEGSFPDTLKRDLVLDRIAAARQHYLDIAFPTSDSVWERGNPPLVGLTQNSPNPFNASTSFECFVDPLSTAAGVDVTLRVYDVSGMRVRDIYRGPLEPGSHRFFWDGRNNLGGPVASGIYFMKMEGHGYSSTIKMILIR